MTLSLASVTLSAPVNCVFDPEDADDVIPQGDFSYHMALGIAGVDSVTSVTYAGGSSYLTLDGALTSWNVAAIPGTNLFPGLAYRLVEFSDSFDPTVAEITDSGDANLEETVFELDPPDVYEVVGTMNFTVSYMLSGSPGVGNLAVGQTFVWDPDIGFGELQGLISGGRF